MVSSYISQGMSMLKFALLVQPLLCQATPVSRAQSNALFQRQDGGDCGANAGGAKCGLGLCCSGSGYCGGTSDYCGDSCQPGFGQCKLPAVPSCSGTSATSGRKVGYYQGTNGFTSGCNQMPPSQIPTEGVSHLIYAFADIDPNSFEVTIAKGEQESWYTDFNALASDSLKTFIAIGGGAFSNPNAETFTTWSDMASSSDNRAKFISSLKSFMEKYGFKGVDLDWEFPGEASRGGKPEDTANLVSLVKEMRESFGTTYGISAALPLYYGDLKAIDVAGMAGSVDFFNIMAYDLAGPDSTTLSSHTDMTKITGQMINFWATGVDPKQFNLGLAYYGTSYTMTDPSCTHIGCPATLAKVQSCSPQAGYLFNAEIPALAGKTEIDQNAMVKTMVYKGDQWVAYDDADTFKLKLGWADQHCLGGSMIWSMDRGARK